MSSSRTAWLVALAVVVAGVLAMALFRRPPVLSSVARATRESSPPAQIERANLAQALEVAETTEATSAREEVLPGELTGDAAAPRKSPEAQPTSHGTIQGSLLLRAGLRSSYFSVRLATGRPAEMGKAGTFRFDNVNAGSHTVELYSCLESEPRWLLSIPEVYVPDTWTPPHLPVQDPRLQQIDVAALVPTAAIHVFDSNGTPVPNGEIGFLPDARRRFVAKSIDWTDGEVVVPLFDPPADVVVMADGYRPQRISSLDGPRDVRLGGTLSVELVVEPSALPGPGMRLAATLLPEQFPLHPFSTQSTSGTQFLDYVGRARFELQWPGRYRIDLRVHGGESAVVESARSMVVSIEERDGVQSIACPVSAADIARAVAQLGR